MYKDKLSKLCGVLKDSNPEDMSIIADAVKSCAGYILAVVELEAFSQTAKLQLEPAEYRDEVMRLDKSRSNAHNSCMANLRIVNRLAQVSGMDDIFPGIDDMDRAEIADMYIKPVADEYFLKRKK